MSSPALNLDSKEALNRARLHASKREKNRADTPDILLALLDSDAARRVMDLFGPEIEKLRLGLQFLGGELEWPNDADAEMRTVDLARAEAVRLGHTEVGSEHLLLGVARQPEAFVAVLLQSTGMSLDATREAVRFIHGDVPDWEPPGAMNTSTALYGGMQAAYSMSAADQPSEEQRALMAELAEEAAVFGNPAAIHLRRVVAIGQMSEIAGVIVEMIALEIRDGAGVLIWRARTAESRMLGRAEITISDNIGTAYRTLPGSWYGSDHESSGELRLIPGPPPNASVMTIEVHSFGGHDPWPGPRRLRADPATGPWHFEVALN